MEKIKNIRKKLRHQRSVRRRKLGLSTPTQIICVSFIAVIALGTLLLTLPIASRHGRLDVLNAMFTATSATCVTGLVVRDTWTQSHGSGRQWCCCSFRWAALVLLPLPAFLRWPCAGAWASGICGCWAKAFRRTATISQKRAEDRGGAGSDV